MGDEGAEAGEVVDRTDVAAILIYCGMVGTPWE